MRVLVVGNGAREHAMCWRLAEEGASVWCAPGNGGTAEAFHNLSISSEDTHGLLRAAEEHRIDLTVVGPEAPLVAGLVDTFEAHGCLAFGPTRAAAQLEGSKVFAKEFMARHDIPTARFAVFDEVDAAQAYVRSTEEPWVVKADGLAAGKGVVVPASFEEAVGAVDRIMRQRAFGLSGARVVLEERLDGEEVSYHVVSDGTRYVSLAPAQDHKRLLDGDQGPNTGGMGAYSPPPVFTPEIEAKVLERIVEPTLAGMRAEGHPFRGALFLGLMIVRGEPYLLEYNVRFGDPECEALMVRARGSVRGLLHGAARGNLSGADSLETEGASCSVVVAAPGYPELAKVGQVIGGLREASAIPRVHVFHGGTQRDGSDVRVAGGRVLAVTASAESLGGAVDQAYRAVDCISFEGKQFRRDIAWRARP